MTREIKFRAWDSRNKRMWYSVSASFYDDGSGPSIDLLGFHPDSDDRSKSLENAILLQYTGLKDKNGKEIYEGDIVKHRQGVDEVHWSEDGFYVGGWTPGNLGEFSDLEGIGNIYENPELIKEMKQ